MIEKLKLGKEDEKMVKVDISNFIIELYKKQNEIIDYINDKEKENGE